MDRLIENDTKIVVDYQTDIDDAIRRADEATTLDRATLANQRADLIMRRCIEISTRILKRAQELNLEVEPIILVYGELS